MPIYSLSLCAHVCVCVYVCVLDLILTSPAYIGEEEEEKREREREKEREKFSSTFTVLLVGGTDATPARLDGSVSQGTTTATPATPSNQTRARALVTAMLHKNTIEYACESFFLPLYSSSENVHMLTELKLP